MPPELLTAEEVARVLRVPVKRVYALKERIRYARLADQTIRFRSEDVVAYVESLLSSFYDCERREDREHMHRICRRCGYSWDEAPLDDGAPGPRRLA